VSYILLIIGFILLIKGADFFVTGAGSVAKKYNVPSLVIGLTIIAFGTSLPELIVNSISSFQGNTGLVTGNVLGSNIANILLILGISALIYPLKVQSTTVWKEIPFSMIAVIVLFLVANDVLFDASNQSLISRGEGLILLMFFILFIYYIFRLLSNETNENDDVNDIPLMSLKKSSLYILAGLLGLVLGGKFIVDGAVDIAFALGISESIIGLTIIAIGTSLPELVTSVVAAIKKQGDMTIGNVVGSNIFNIFFILGVSAVIRPIPFDLAANIDIYVDMLATFLLFIFCFIGRKQTLTKIEGILFLVIYFSYMGYLIVNEVLQ
jgi:cation:H+ antiporter